MATRMQQRRGTAAQWTGANPILAAGEIGFETDTGKFKIGNGSSTWSSLNYYVDANAILDGAPGVLDTLNELAAALGDDPAFITTVATNLSNHESDTSNVHGIANTANLVTLSGTQELTNKTLTGASIDSTTTAVTQSSIDNTTKIATTEFVQGRINSVISASPELLNTLSELAAAINDDPDFSTTVANNIATKVSKAGDTMTGALTLPGDPTENLHAATKAYVDGGLSSHESDTTNVHGIADTAALTTQAYVDNALSAHQSDTTNVHGIADTDALATKDYADSALNAHQADTTNVHGIADTSALVTQTYVDTALSTHISDTTNVHGIDDTAELATKSYADAAVSTHGSDTTNVHGIGDTANLATQAYADGAVSTHNSDTTDVHGIADTSVLVVTSDSRLSDDRTPSDNTVSTIKIVDSAVTADKIASDAVTTIKIVNSAVTADKIAGDAVTTAKIEDGAVTSAKIADGTIVNADINASAAIAQSKIADLTTDLADKAPLASPTFTGTVSGITKTMVGLGNVDNTADADKPVSTATQTALDAKASLSGATFTGSVEIDQNLTVDGNLTVNGTTFNASATSITIEDNMVQLAHQNAANTVDLGIVVAYNDGAAKHAGIVRDVSDAKWKLFKDVSTEPSTTVAFGEGSLDALAVGALEATTVTPSSGVVFSDGTQTKEGVASRTPIIAKTDSYTLSALTERDSLIEVNKASAATITIPTNATVAYPVGTSIDILQTGAGQVTIAGASGVTVNGTPGLKLRTQWSSATLFKRATDTWVVMGDLSA